MGAEKNLTEIPEKLRKWQERLSQSDLAFSPEIEKMDKRDRVYNGERKIEPLVPGDEKKDGGSRQTSHVRNIVFENIESQVNSNIPMPKVTPYCKEDEHLAQIIENFIRNELDRLPFETMNDLAERTVPIQGGVGYLLEWDHRRRTHTTIGEAAVSVIHPKQFAPQPGIFGSIEDMDWFIIKMPTTKEAIRRRYGKSVYAEGEAEPEVRSVKDPSPADDAVTQYIGFARNDQGGIDLYSWVNDVELEDLENYQARRLPTCKNCGRVKPFVGQIIHREPEETAGGANAERLAQVLAQQAMMPAGEEGGMHLPLEAPGTPEKETYNGGVCPWCGSDEFTNQPQEFEEIWIPMTSTGGVVIPGMHPGEDGQMAAVMVPTKIPYYKPDLFPIVLQKSVSIYGQLLGNSDVDAIMDQQNTTNRIEQKIIDRLIKAGTRITLPNKANLMMDPADGERWYLEKPEEAAMIGVYEFTGNLQYELSYLAQVYEESRQILGINDSFQGRRDPTATSGKAKEFAASMAAGRLESKRVMKNAAYAALFERMFKFALAYSDEPRPVSFKNFRGETEYQVFSRYDFLKQDEAGQWYYNDRFLFSCDTSAPLANNREAMWQETRMNLQTGAFGDPTKTETLILFWGKMELLHYPGAGSTKAYLEERLQREQEMAQMMQKMQSAQQSQIVQGTQTMGGQTGNPMPTGI